MMNKVGFLISDKLNEKRRAILPNDLRDFKYSNFIYIEKGYGNSIGINDLEYENFGVNIVDKRTIYESCEVICDPKIGDATYLMDIPENKIFFGWIHAVQNRKLTEFLVNRNHTVIAWEDMFDEEKHSFYKNNFIAGEASVLHALVSTGMYPFGKKAAIIGNGNTSKGAQNILNKLNVEFDIYDRKSSSKLADNLLEYDIIINAILWDTNNPVTIISREDLLKMKRNSIIIDISCDRNGAIESSVPTNINEPIYYEQEIAHYAVDHTPSLFPVETTSIISEVVLKYLERLVKNDFISDRTLNNAIIIKERNILDSKILNFQNKKLV